MRYANTKGSFSDCMSDIIRFYGTKDFVNLTIFENCKDLLKRGITNHDLKIKP